ncbi:MAG TPA: hypothetical protein VHP33_03720 [Polyangiaceae bacterium]|nr:hypothetical protein [Polyangiaceae bacterium]
MAAVAAPRSAARVLLASVALGAPFLLAAHAAAGLAAPFSQSVVNALLRATAPFAAAAPEPEPEPEVTELAPAAPAELSFEVATKAHGARVGRPVAKVKPSALFVSEATVLRLAQSSARPQGSFVAQSDQHPAGLRLSGVAALGIGVQDGDILIEALGITPRAPGQVIGAIIEARAKQARFLSGTLWRQGQTFAITVEQPYLRTSPPS